MKKTVLQNVIEELETTLVNHIRLNDDEKFILKDVVKILNSKLLQEKQDLIDAFDEASLDGDKLGLMYFNQTFES